jgi:hypothetical protein
VFAFTRTINSEKVLVMVNLRNTGVTYPVPTDMANGNWKNVYDGTSVSVGQQVMLGPYEYIVLGNQ